MSNLRFYHALPLVAGNTVKLSDNAASHATRVLRLGVSDEIILFNGDKHDYICAIISIKKNEVLAIVKSHLTLLNESPLHITLLQGISSNDRMDFTIQKAVELGVSAIVPIFTERSQVKLTHERAEKRQEHWQNVVHSACEQSGRALVPIVAMPIQLSAWLAANNSTAKSHINQALTPLTRLLLDPVGATRLAQIPKPAGQIQLLVGAEGGLAKSEIELAHMQGFQSISLGPRILRTETAALTAIASMQTLWGDF